MVCQNICYSRRPLFFNLYCVKLRRLSNFVLRIVYSRIIKKIECDCVCVHQNENVFADPPSRHFLTPSYVFSSLGLSILTPLSYVKEKNT